MSTDAIVVLKEDHKLVSGLFRQFEKAEDDETKAAVVTRILEELTVHTYIENVEMYPRTRELVPDLEDDILESYEEHHVVDVLCWELSSMTPADERFDAKVTVLIENVEHHVEEEEEEWFPKVREALGRKELQEIGARMIELKKTAPRTPQNPATSTSETVGA